MDINYAHIFSQPIADFTPLRDALINVTILIKKLILMYIPSRPKLTILIIVNL